jgi:putative transposase
VLQVHRYVRLVSKNEKEKEKNAQLFQRVADTKYTLDISPLFRKGEKVIGRRPTAIVSDGAPNFHDAYNKVYWTYKTPQTKHIRHIRLQGDRNNNKMERFNGEG